MKLRYFFEGVPVANAALLLALLILANLDENGQHASKHCSTLKNVCPYDCSHSALQNVDTTRYDYKLNW